MNIKQLREEFDRVIEKGVAKHVGVENSDHWLIEEIDMALRNGIIHGTLAKIQKLENIFDSL